MQIILNGTAQPARDDATLQELVTQLSDRQSGIAVAVNASVVPRSSWPDTIVRDGDRIDVVTAVQGG